MKKVNSLGRPLLLALVGVVGIVGMLLSEGWGDALCFVLAMVPLAAGAWYVHAQRAAGVSPTRRAKEPVS